MIILTLSLYVLAYGSGAMLFAPLSGSFGGPSACSESNSTAGQTEIPSLGRNGFYIWPMLACKTNHLVLLH